MKTLEKYVKYEYKKESLEPLYWNRMTFYECKVLSIQVQDYEAGKRMSIEIEAPKLKKKYYLFAWSDNGICQAILDSKLKEGDYISCHAELSYYKNKEGRSCSSFRIVADDSFIENQTETPRYFKLMRIKRVIEEKEKATGYISKNELIKKMLG